MIVNSKVGNDLGYIVKVLKVIVKSTIEDFLLVGNFGKEELLINVFF